MAVDVIERVVVTNPTTATSVAATIATTPQPGDVVVVRYSSVRSAGARSVSAMTGLGASWAKVFDGTRIEFWVGTGANAAGSVTADLGGLAESSNNSGLDVVLVRGLPSATVSTASETVGTATSLAGPAGSAGTGQFVLAAGTTQATSGATFPAASTTPAGWTSSAPLAGSNGSHGGAYRVPSAAGASHRADVASATSVALTAAILVLGVEGAVAPADVTVAGQVGAVTAAVSAATVVDVSLTGQVAPVAAAVTAATLVDAALAGQIGPVTAAVAVEALPDVVTVDLAGQVGAVSAIVSAATLADISLAAQVGSVTGAFDVTATDPVPVIGVDLRNRINGRARSGRAAVRFEPAVVAPPETAVLPLLNVGAQALSAVTMADVRPVYAATEVTKPRLRHRIIVGGRDVSFYRDVATPEPGYQLAEPLLWGAMSIELPQVSACFETPGKGALRWCRKGAPVVLQRVTRDGEVVSTDYRGVVVAHDVSGPTLRLEVGGDATGRAALRHKPLPIFRDTLDLGRLAWAGIRDLGLRFEPRLGPETGIRQALFGGMDHLTYLTELCAKAWDRDGQWTIMPSDAGVYRMKRKDTTTVHFTVFTDETRAVPHLRSDAAEEPNRIFATGVTPKGQRVRFGVYPGLKQGKPAPYPFDDDRDFGPGTTDAQTDTGDGITVMVRRLWTMGYLSLEDSEGTYNADVWHAIAALQKDAGLDEDGYDGYIGYGMMTPALWRALWDLDVTGYTLRGSRVEPAAQAPRTRRYNRSASGAVIGKNRRFDPHALISDRPVDFGAGFTRHQMRAWSDSEIARGEDNWVGTIDITTGGVFHGKLDPGATPASGDVMDVRAIQPGMNAWLPVFGRGILVHVSGVEIGYTPDGIPTAKLYVDTQARDAMAVWEIIRRNRETRRDPARRWHGGRASSQVKDSIDVWDEVGGVLDEDVDLKPGWNVIRVVAGQEGNVSRLRLVVQDVTATDGTIAIAGREFACAVFGRKVTPARLRHLIGNPLAASRDETAEPTDEQKDPPTVDPEAGDADPAVVTSPVGPWWERQKIQKALRDLDLLYSAGTREEPCGYSPGRKAAGATRTGLHRDDAGFSYRTRREPVLYLAVWVWGERTLSGGRVMWPQLEAGA